MEITIVKTILKKKHFFKVRIEKKTKDCFIYPFNEPKVEIRGELMPNLKSIMLYQPLDKVDIHTRKNKMITTLKIPKEDLKEVVKYINE